MTFANNYQDWTTYALFTVNTKVMLFGQYKTYK